MTYNFDVERWYETQLRLLDDRRLRGEIGREEYEAEVKRLDEGYDEMQDRLDRAYVLHD